MRWKIEKDLKRLIGIINLIEMTEYMRHECCGHTMYGEYTEEEIWNAHWEYVGGGPLPGTDTYKVYIQDPHNHYVMRELYVDVMKVCSGGYGPGLTILRVYDGNYYEDYDDDYDEEEYYDDYDDEEEYYDEPLPDEGYYEDYNEENYDDNSNDMNSLNYSHDYFHNYNNGILILHNYNLNSFSNNTSNYGNDYNDYYDDEEEYDETYGEEEYYDDYHEEYNNGLSNFNYNFNNILNNYNLIKLIGLNNINNHNDDYNESPSDEEYYDEDY